MIQKMVALGLVLFCGPGLGAGGQEGQIQEKVTVALKLVQAYVTAKDGKPVTDLTAADFQVTDNGKPVTVTHFENHVLGGDDLAGERRGAVPGAEGTPAAGTEALAFLRLTGRAIPFMIFCRSARDYITPRGTEAGFPADIAPRSIFGEAGQLVLDAVELVLGLLEELGFEGDGVDSLGLAHRPLQAVDADEDLGLPLLEPGDIFIGQAFSVHGFSFRNPIVSRTALPGKPRGVKPKLFNFLG